MRNHHRGQASSARVIHEASAVGRALLLFTSCFIFLDHRKTICLLLCIQVWAHGSWAQEAFPTSEPGVDTPYISVSHQVNACDPAENSEKRQGDGELMKWPHRTWLILVHNIHIYHNHTGWCPEGPHKFKCFNPLKSRVLGQNTQHLNRSGCYSLLLFPKQEFGTAPLKILLQENNNPKNKEAWKLPIQIGGRGLIVTNTSVSGGNCS